MVVGRRVLRLSIIAGVGLGVVLAVLAWPLPAPVHARCRPWPRGPRPGCSCWPLSQLPAAVAMGLDGVLIGGGDYRFLGRASVAYLAAFAPFAIATLVWPALGIVGVWLAMPVWLVARAVTNLVRFERRRWAHARVSSASSSSRATHGSSPDQRRRPCRAASAAATLPGWSSTNTQPSGVDAEALAGEQVDGRVGLAHPDLARVDDARRTARSGTAAATCRGRLAMLFVQMASR